MNLLDFISVLPSLLNCVQYTVSAQEIKKKLGKRESLKCMSTYTYLSVRSVNVGDVPKAFAAYKRDFLLKLRVRVWGMEGLLEYVISKL